MRALALKVVLVLVGLVFLATAYPLLMLREPALQMMLGVYVTLGLFLLFAVRNPSANRSLIAFTAWSSLVHAAIMAVQLSRHMIQRGELAGVIVLAIVGIALIALAPPKMSVAES